MRKAAVQISCVAVLVALHASVAAAQSEPCGDVTFRDNLVVMTKPLPLELPLSDNTRACVRSLADDLKERPYVRSLTIIVRMADEDRKNGHALKLAQALDGELMAAGVSPRLTSAVAPAVGHGQKPGVFLAYTERHIGRAVARVEAKLGSVSVGRHASDMRAGEPGHKIHAHDRMTTASGTVALVAIADGSQMFMWPDTKVRFGNIGLNAKYQRAVRIDVEQGEVEMLVSKAGEGAAFELITGAAVAGVRGTRFRLIADGEKGTRLETLTGEVELKNDLGAESVPAAFGSRAAASQAPDKARPLLPSPARLQPLSGSFTSAPTLSWAPVANAVGYRVEIAENPRFTVNPQRFASTATSLALTVRLSVKKWYWRVMAIDADGFVGMPSKHYTFGIKPAAGVSAKP